MPELRKDPVMGRWVIIATERARRPGNFIFNPRNVFTHRLGKISEAVNTVKSGQSDSSWKVRVLPSGDPFLRPDIEFRRQGKGLYDVLNGYGVHEVVIDTPDAIANMADLSPEQIKLAIDTYVSRVQDLEKNPLIQYVFIFKNYVHPDSESEVNHSYSEVMASPVIPLHIKDKLKGAKQYFLFHERCVYTDVVRQECETKVRIVKETEHFLAIIPFASRFPFEVWILPKQHHCDFHKGVIGKEFDLAIILKDILSRFKSGLDDPSYTLVINTAPFRRYKPDEPKWKTIEEDYCWHIELTPRLTRVAGFEKGTGFYICAISPEQSAEFLRTVEL